MGLRCGTYGEIYGDGYGIRSVGIYGRDCGVGPMGFIRVYGTAVWDRDLWASGWGPMGFAGVYRIAVLGMRLDRDYIVRWVYGFAM